MSENPFQNWTSLNIFPSIIIAIAAIFSISGCSPDLDLSEMLPLESLVGDQPTQESFPESPDTTQELAETSVLFENTDQPVIFEEMTAFDLLGEAEVTTQPCTNQAAPGRPIDVNIPDDTIMQPGQEFNKTWRLINIGTCTWNSTYQVVWYWGEQMSGVLSFPLQGETPPGEQADITVSLVAPNQPGVYQSNWKLRGPSGNIFGVGPGEGLYFYVRIIVAGSPVPNENEHGLVVKNTPTAFAGGLTRLLPADRIDLDRNILNPTVGEDIALNSGVPYILVPFETAFISIYGKTQPTENQCLSTTPSKTPIQVNSLEPGTYICYLTDEGRTGWMHIQNFWTFQDRAMLNVEVYTWPLP